MIQAFSFLNIPFQVYSVRSFSYKYTGMPIDEIISIIDKPELTSTTSSPYIIIEGQTAALGCRLTTANPNSRITWKWYKTDNPSTVLHNESKFTVPNIKRKMSGSYSCTASNSAGTSEAVNINIDIQCEYFI